jgi:methanogenic corrinoid protein MtbC1
MPADRIPPETRVQQLEHALETFDEAGGHRILADLFAELDVEAALSEVLLPYLRAVGDRWESGHIGVAQEHFASGVLRSRLSLLMHDAAQAVTASRPLVVLACLPGERHELGLMAAALTLSRLDWQVCYLGANTPTAELALACRTLRPDAVLVSALRPTAFAAHAPALRRLGDVTTVYLGAAGASAEIADLCGATHLDGDPVWAARFLDEEHGPAARVLDDAESTAV